jgi:hypothetical protein
MMWKIACSGLIVLTVALACRADEPAVSSTQPIADERDPQRISQAADATAKQRIAQIKQEIKASPEHDWAGQYYQGDGLGMNLSLFLAPRSGFHFEWHGCLGLYNRESGKVDVENGRIKLRGAVTDESLRMNKEFVPVKWGERRYLLPPDSLISFVNDINQGSEPRKDIHGSFFLRWGDEDKPAKGRPGLPEPFKSYVRETPLKAKVAEVGKSSTTQHYQSKYQLTPITLDVGAADAVFVGMVLYAKGRGSMPQARVKEVTEHTCKAVFRQETKGAIELREGLQFSSAPSWR